MADGKVDVAGLGRLPAHFSKTFDGINVAGISSSRRHNEGDYEFTCKRNLIFKDRVTIAGNDQGQKYRFDLDFNTWSGSAFWRRGKAVLIYDKATQSWRIQTFKADGTRWDICNPEAILDGIAGRNVDRGQIAVHGVLECFNIDSASKPLNEIVALNAVVASLRAQRNGIIAQVPRYEGRSDCHAETSEVTAHSGTDYAP